MWWLMYGLLFVSLFCVWRGVFRAYSLALAGSWLLFIVKRLANHEDVVAELRTRDAGLGVIEDLRPDVLSLSELKHKATHLFDMSVTVYKPTVKLFELKGLDSEMLTQLLTPAVCHYGMREEDVFCRINQSLKSIHTVNENRFSVLEGKLNRQDLALAAQLIYKARKAEVEDLLLNRQLFPQGP